MNDEIQLEKSDTLLRVIKYDVKSSNSGFRKHAELFDDACTRALVVGSSVCEKSKCSYHYSGAS